MHIKKYVIVSALFFLAVPFLGGAQSEPIQDVLVEQEAVGKTNRQEFPDRARPSESTDLQDWIDILPTGDRGESRFLVYPKMGLAAPLLEPSDTDVEKISRNKMFDHYTYLENGVLQYIGADIGEIGTAIIAGHSSFRDDAYNPYYTVFQAVPLSDVGEEIWVYERGDHETTRYIFRIQESYETAPTNRDQVEEQREYASLTTYSCFPIGSNKSRRVNHAKLVETEIVRVQDVSIHIEPVSSQKLGHSAAPYDTAVAPGAIKNVALPQNIKHEERKESLKAQILARNKSQLESPVVLDTQGHDSADMDSETINPAPALSLLDRESITIYELVNLYMGAKHSVFKKQLLIKIVIQIKEQKKKLLGVSLKI